MQWNSRGIHSRAHLNRDLVQRCICSLWETECGFLSDNPKSLSYAQSQLKIQIEVWTLAAQRVCRKTT